MMNVNIGSAYVPRHAVDAPEIVASEAPEYVGYEERPVTADRLGGMALGNFTPDTSFATDAGGYQSVQDQERHANSPGQEGTDPMNRYATRMRRLGLVDSEESDSLGPFHRRMALVEKNPTGTGSPRVVPTTAESIDDWQSQEASPRVAGRPGFIRRVARAILTMKQVKERFAPQRAEAGSASTDPGVIVPEDPVSAGSVTPKRRGFMRVQDAVRKHGGGQETGGRVVARTPAAADPTPSVRPFEKGVAGMRAYIQERKGETAASIANAMANPGLARMRLDQYDPATHGTYDGGKYLRRES